MPILTQSAPFPAVSLNEAADLLTAAGMACEIEVAEVEGRRLPVWKNAPASLAAVLQASRAHGDRIAFIHEDERVSFEAHWRAASALARALSDLGIVKGDRVAIVMRNLPEWPVAFYAAASLGAIVTPLNAWWTPDEVAYAMQDSQARVLILDGERFARLREMIDTFPVQQILVARPTGPLDHRLALDMGALIGLPGDWSALPDQSAPAVDIGPEDDAALFYTSGTTGLPKGVLASQRGVNSNVITALYANQRAQLRRGEPVVAPGADNVQPSGLISVPFFHVTGCVAIMNPSLFGGAKVAMMRKFDAVEAFSVIERERLAAAGGVPAIAWQLLEHPRRSEFDLSSLTSIAWGGAPSSPALVRRLVETFPGLQPGQGWGMTETCGTFSGHSGEDFVLRPDSCGPASPVGRFEVRDPDDGVTPLATGEIGELWAFGPMNARGYWNNPEATAATFVDGWVRTGDLARLDDEGFCYIVDRAKDMLIRGGENIYCIEVESILYAHPDVMDAAVVGLPHPTLGEEPEGVVTLRPGGTAGEDEILEFCAARLAPYKRPVAIRFHDGPLPRNPNGKILKKVLTRAG